MRASFIVLTNAVEGKDAEFNRWYDEAHLRDVTSVPGVVSARRAPVIPIPGKAHSQSYLAIYEVEHDEPASVIAEIFRRWESGEMESTDTMATFEATLFGPFGKEVSSVGA
ncbi:hypothetical protein SAMN02927924_00348 [Sphingobium faniae]|nr:hypothetical protein SAMN02927924_00348 [Sphingobium faniae]